jgi:hypothetical protein
VRKIIMKRMSTGRVGGIFGSGIGSDYYEDYAKGGERTR